MAHNLDLDQFMVLECPRQFGNDVGSQSFVADSDNWLQMVSNRPELFSFFWAQCQFVSLIVGLWSLKVAIVLRAGDQ